MKLSYYRIKEEKKNQIGHFRGGRSFALLSLLSFWNWYAIDIICYDELENTTKSIIISPSQPC
jgi:hypothetical protein